MPLAKDYLRQRFRDTFGGDHLARLARRHDVRRRSAGCRGKSRRGWARATREPDLEAALVAIDPQTGDVLALIGGRDYTLWPSTVPADPVGSRVGVRAGSLHRGARAWLCADVHADGQLDVDRAARAGRVVRPETPSSESTAQLTLRAALLESDNRAATLLQQRVGSRQVLKLRQQRGLAGICPMCRRCRWARDS